MNMLAVDPVTSDRVELDEEWSLWRDFAVRSAGFPVEGLGAFGADEGAQLAVVARDPAFREAVAWQSRESLRHAVEKLAADAPGSASRRRRWIDVVGRYWQRYCAKNDTIGYFGPLAWGSFAEDGNPVTVCAGMAAGEHVVHFETWAIEAVAAAAGITTPLPMCPFPERALRPLLADTSGLDRLEAARDAVVAARGDAVAAALDELDAAFEAVAGRPAVRCADDSGGGRTVVYLDCMRDLDLTLGPPVLDELRNALPPVLHASRWWCGRVFDRAQRRLCDIAHERSGPIAPMLGELMAATFALWNQMGAEQRELQRRWASVINGTCAAADAFADWTPAWHGSCYHSADLQIAASSQEAIARGDFLLVLGDFHGGANPLLQGLFGLRHPTPEALMQRVADEAGPGVRLSPPRRGMMESTARLWPIFTDGDVVVAGGEEPAPRGTCRIALEDVVVDNGRVSDAAGTFLIPSQTSSGCRSSFPRCAASTRSDPDRRARRSDASWCAGRPGLLPPANFPLRLRTLRRGRTNSACRAESSFAHRSSASQSSSTWKVRRSAARWLASYNQRAIKRPTSRSNSPRCSLHPTSAGSKIITGTTRASCAWSCSSAHRNRRTDPARPTELPAHRDVRRSLANASC